MRLTGVNVLAALASLAGSMGLATGFGPMSFAVRESPQASHVEGIRDATGHVVMRREYRRIVGTNGVADSLLHALAEPDRVLAYSLHGATQSKYAFRYAGKPTVDDVDELERLLALEPDLVLVHSLGRRDRVERMRSVGLRVFDLGAMHGMSTLLPNIASVAALLGEARRGHDLAQQFTRRMQALAQHVPLAERPRGMYIGTHGNTLFGGTDGSSYHDVITAAGLIDGAAEHFDGWPRYTSEQILELDPDIVVTQAGMRAALCRHPGLDELRACNDPRGVVEIDRALIGDPSLSMLDAAEALYQAVFEIEA